MVIYTKRGDRGKTALYDETSSQKDRISKDSLEVYALGAIDELNSFLGIVISICENPKLEGKLKETQKDLLTIGSILAGSKLRFFKTKTKRLEGEIDKLEGLLPVLKNFILPGGSKLAAHIHYARAISRRVESEVVSLNQISLVKPQILTYLNRLSDYLFMLARSVNYKFDQKEEVWVGRKK